MIIGADSFETPERPASAEEQARRAAELAEENARQVAEQNARRAAQYADEAATAINRARISLGGAAAVAAEAGEMSGRVRQGANELIGQGENLSHASEPRRYLAGTEDAVGLVQRRAELGAEMLRDVRDQLERTRQELRIGRSAVVQLSRLPGQQTELVNSLQDRLDGLEDAVHRADRTAGEVAGKLAVAQGNVEPLAQQARMGDLQVTADTVRTTGSNTDRNLDHAQDDLARLGRNIADVSPELSEAQQESIHLEQMLRAAANPTPVSQQKEAGSASQEGTFTLRPGEGANRGSGYSR